LTAAVECGDPPRSVAVLPFINHTDIEGIEKEFRLSVFSQITVHPYRDVELSEIDARLLEKGLMENLAFTKEPVRELGRILKCDAVVIGEVENFYRIYLGIYSQMTVEGSVTIWDTRTGERIWTDVQKISKREGGVPLDLLDIPLISVRSGFNLRNGNQEELTEELAELLISRIPAPACYLVDSKNEVRFAYELQVGAYLTREHAVRLKTYLEDRGYPANIRSNWDERGFWHRVFLGSYEDKEVALNLQKEIRENIGTHPILARIVLSDASGGDRLE
jgi:hypothetical protein